MNKDKLLKIVFPIVTTLLGVCIGALITINIQTSDNKEILVYKIAACYNEYTENSKICDGLWEKNKIEQEIAAKSISFEPLNLLLEDPLIYEFLEPYYCSFVCPKLRRSNKITEFFMQEVQEGIQLDGTLKAIIASEFNFQKDFLKRMALELTDSETWKSLKKDLDDLYPDPSLHF